MTSSFPARTGLRLRQVLRSLLRLCLVPLRRLVATLLDRFPSLEPRVSGWTWLWQPGWSRTDHERLYASEPDPYGFEKPLERRKYDETLRLVDGRRFARALEVGASEGVFTEMLLDRCDEVVATEVSEVALERARARVGRRPGVTLERMALPFELPDGTFDLVVCSDVVYLWSTEVVERGLRRLAERLRPGGSLLLLNYLGEFGQVTPTAWVHECARDLARDLGLTSEGPVDFPYRGPHDAGYLADVFTRPA